MIESFFNSYSLDLAWWREFGIGLVQGALGTLMVLLGLWFMSGFRGPRDRGGRR